MVNKHKTAGVIIKRMKEEKIMVRFKIQKGMNKAPYLEAYLCKYPRIIIMFRCNRRYVILSFEKINDIIIIIIMFSSYLTSS